MSNFRNYSNICLHSELTRLETYVLERITLIGSLFPRPASSSLLDDAVDISTLGICAGILELRVNDLSSYTQALEEELLGYFVSTALPEV